MCTNGTSLSARLGYATLAENGGTAMIVDADAHVIETDVTWDFITQEDLANAPVIASGTDTKGQEQDYWIIDGQARPRGGVGNTGSMFPRGARELVDVPGPLQHMD